MKRIGVGYLALLIAVMLGFVMNSDYCLLFFGIALTIFTEEIIKD